MVYGTLITISPSSFLTKKKCSIGVPKMTILNRVMILVNFSRQIRIPHPKISKNDHSLATSASLSVFLPKKGKKCSIGAPKMTIVNKVMILVNFSRQIQIHHPKISKNVHSLATFASLSVFFYRKRAKNARSGPRK